MRRWTIEVTERELCVIIAAMGVCREGAALHVSHQKWWTETKYVTRLYERLREHGLRDAA